MLQLCSTGGDPYNSEIFLLPCIAHTLVCRKMAWLGIIFHLDGYAKSTKFILSGSILFLPPYTGGEDERLVWAGIEPRSSCFTFTSNSSYHWTMALRTLNLEINRTKFIPVAYYEQGRKNTFILCQAPSGLVVNFTTSAHQLDWKVQLEISLTNGGPST